MASSLKVQITTSTEQPPPHNQDTAGSSNSAAANRRAAQDLFTRHMDQLRLGRSEPTSPFSDSELLTLRTQPDNHHISTPPSNLRRDRRSLQSSSDESTTSDAHAHHPYQDRLNRQPEVDASLLADMDKLYLVVGGSGFLGRHIVEHLLDGGCRVRVLDLKQSFEDPRIETFFIGDVRKAADVSKACEGVDCVFHCASMTDPWAKNTDLYAVNVDGAFTVIQACVRQRVPQLVYTSTSAVVISAGDDIRNGDENLKYPAEFSDHYSRSKALAEKLVLSANGSKFAKLTDRQQVEALRRRGPGVHQTPSSPPSPTNGPSARNRQDPAEDSDKSELPTELLTCVLRPHAMFGPRDTHFIAQLVAKARSGDITHMIGEGQNVVDFTFVENAVYAHILAAEKLVPGAKCAGKAYFITNGEPRLFWEFVTQILRQVGCVGPTKYISYNVAYAFAFLMESFHWLVARFINFKPTITRQMVTAMACHHWFNHSRASKDLGYEPIVSLDEGVIKTINWAQTHADSSYLSDPAPASWSFDFGGAGLESSEH